MQRFVYVSNVTHASDLADIEDLFLMVGDIKNKKIEMIPESGHRLGFGVFEMSTSQQARDCVERFNGTVNEGKQLSLSYIRPKKRAVTSSIKEATKKTKLR